VFGGDKLSVDAWNYRIRVDANGFGDDGGGHKAIHL
jgi:hypothetical protein